MAALGIVTGLRSEARAARHAMFKAGLAGGVADVVCAGPGLAQARAAARRLVDAGARLLLSFGVAGALKGDLRPGTLLVPETVLERDRPPLATDGTPGELLVMALAATGPVSRGPLLSVGDVVVSAAQKAELTASSDAIAIDMESYGVGEVAQAAGLPFMVLRAIADPAARAIPPAALAGVTADGGVQPLKVLAALARTPGDAVELARLGRDNARAMASLGRAARLAFPLLLVGR